MADGHARHGGTKASKAAPTATRKYVIYFIHDLHGYLEGVLSREDRRVGGVKSIVEHVKAWRETDLKQGEIDGVFVCLGGDMVSEYRSRKLDRNNVVQVWKYMLDQIKPHAWVLGNHELDPEYTDRLIDMIGCGTKTCCTRNLMWTGDFGNFPLGHANCLHQSESIPSWSEHVTTDGVNLERMPVVFTGLTVAKAGWRPDGYRKVPDAYECAKRKECLDKDWRKVCKRFIAECKNGNPLYGLIKGCMNKVLFKAVKEVGIGASKKLSPKFQTQMADVLNKMLCDKVLYFDNRDVFSAVVESGRLSSDAEALTEKEAGDLTDCEAMFLNAALLRPTVAPALVCAERHRFRVQDPEHLIDRLRQSPPTGGCQRGADDFLHVHIAHFGDVSPEEFGSNDGPWLNGGSGYGLPTVILKAHDHRVSSEDDTIPADDKLTERNLDAKKIPTFEAGRNGASLGKLTLTVPSDPPKCDWQTLHPGEMEELDDIDRESMGLNDDGNAGSYPVIAEHLDFARMGGSPFSSDELYRAVTLLLRSASCRCRREDVLIVACPSAVIADSCIEESDSDNEGRIDLFDISHVFGHREELHTIDVSNAQKLTKGIKKALGNPLLAANSLPSMPGGALVSGHETWMDAMIYWYYPPAMCPPDVKVGRILCLRWKKKEFLVVTSPVSKESVVDPREIKFYELVQLGNEYRPVFRCLPSECTIETFVAHLEIKFPLKICLDRFLAEKSGWRGESISLADGKLIQIIAEYIRDCAHSGQGLWRL